MLNITEFTYADSKFLQQMTKYKEFFFVIDNTDFPNIY